MELDEYNLIYNARLRHYIQLLFSISILPQRASGRELMWVKALTAEESPSSSQSPPLGLWKPFMFVFDLKGKYTPDAIYMYCRPAPHAVPHFTGRELCLLRAKASFNHEYCAAAICRQLGLLITVVWLFHNTDDDDDDDDDDMKIFSGTKAAVDECILVHGKQRAWLIHWPGWQYYFCTDCIFIIILYKY